MDRGPGQKYQFSAVVKEETNKEMNDTNESLAAATKRRKVPIIFEDSDDETLVVKEEPKKEPLESYKEQTLVVKEEPDEEPLERYKDDTLVVKETPDEESSNSNGTLLVERDNKSFRRRKTKRNTKSRLTESAPPAQPRRQLVECGDREAPPTSPMQHLAPAPAQQPRRLREGDTSNLVHHGSDSDSDSDNEESSGVVPLIPRVFRSMMETPLDNENAAAADTVSLEPAEESPTETTEQPRALYDFDWRDFPNPPIPPKSRREAFSEINVGPTTPCTDPYDIFVEIWDRQIMEHIASETNRYAQQVTAEMLANHNLHPGSRISQWRDTTTDELYAFFGIILAMGIVVKSRLEDYWGATPDIFYTPGFGAHMSSNRFHLLSKCLHFNNNYDMRAQRLEGSEARLYKIQPILSHLNLKFQTLYIPAQNIALDESLLMWKGWLDVSQLIPNKAANRGIKTYEVCESQTGYLWRFEVHAQKNSAPQRSADPMDAATPSIVLRLTQGLENKGYTLWMDNYYNSPCLARRLKSLGFDCVGTLRTDRYLVPAALRNLTNQNMRKGEISGLTSGDVDVMVWRDANRVAMISTYHGNGQQTLRGSTKPILIHDYNIMMGGVDKKDQMLAMYPIERQRTKVWYKKLFRRLLNLSVLNSYIIHRHTSTLSHRNFRISLVKSLLSKHAPPPLLPATTQNQRVDVTHRLNEYPKSSNQRQRLRRTCVACKKLVHTYCVGCSRTVCMNPCFLTIHS